MMVSLFYLLYLCLLVFIYRDACWFSPLMAFVFELCLCGWWSDCSFSDYSEVCAGCGQCALISAKMWGESPAWHPSWAWWSSSFVRLGQTISQVPHLFFEVPRVRSTWLHPNSHQHICHLRSFLCEHKLLPWSTSEKLASFILLSQARWIPRDSTPGPTLSYIHRILSLFTHKTLSDNDPLSPSNLPQPQTEQRHQYHICLCAPTWQFVPQNL